MTAVITTTINHVQATIPRNVGALSLRVKAREAISIIKSAISSWSIHEIFLRFVRTFLKANRIMRYTIPPIIPAYAPSSNKDIFIPPFNSQIARFLSNYICHCH
ncbi:hypothetical protein PF1094 [Pyrococcus furiosus DSM 3638]|uniref:Uncharacterized protein n=1 Tax=Pyrococcus furiosus (strain ATCC 43587 / DSM 3638 / JCM 8422 / Vc1) TaxID=186497 RepID=Q8U1W0_PYRFU|nr:hypothetical protein PF1094 [Pyrococcus furiosus DSM 3638]